MAPFYLNYSNTYSEEFADSASPERSVSGVITGSFTVKPGLGGRGAKHTLISRLRSCNIYVNNSVYAI